LAPRRLYVEDVERISVEYDPGSDTLYIHFGEDEDADEVLMTESGVIVRIKNGKLIGMVVTEFSLKAGYEG
jgi:uncharacterized protein YuzE